MFQGSDALKREDLVLLGMPEEFIDEWMEHPTDPPQLLVGCGVIVRLFLTLKTQWRVLPMAGAVGLDYAAIPAAAQMMGIKMTPVIFEGLQILEQEWLEATKTKKKPLRLPMMA